MSGKFIALLAIALGFAAFASAASSQSVNLKTLRNDPAVQAAIAACQADAKALCNGVKPGGGRILRCLAAQPDKVSPNCQSAITAAKTSLEKAGISLPETTAQ